MVTSIHETLDFSTITTKAEYSCLIAHNEFSFSYVVICVYSQLIPSVWYFDQINLKSLEYKIMISILNM